jgi:Transposase and inactivated derivatives, IS5 family
MTFTGLFDIQSRLSKLDRTGDPLVLLKTSLNWELFRPELEAIRTKERKSNAGRKAYDVILMFKMLVLQSLYNLSDDQLEIQVLDRLSFMRFLDLNIGDNVPDAKTIWSFKEVLNKGDRVQELFMKFDDFLRTNGFQARKGQIVDASIVRVPIQRNNLDENKRIKSGEGEDVCKQWPSSKASQKDVDARWTKKNGRSYYGYKNHISVDAGGKFIRHYSVTDASVHDSNIFLELLDDNNSSRDVWADSAYRCAEHEYLLAARGFRGHLQRKGYRGHPLSERAKRGNRSRSRIRSRVEHVFGVMRQRAGNLIIRCIGIIRGARTIGLRNLAYNMSRYALLTTMNR